MELQDGRVDVSISMGVAQWPLDSDTIDGLLRVADARMYQDKYAGRRAMLDEVAALN